MTSVSDGIRPEFAGLPADKGKLLILIEFDDGLSRYPDAAPT